MTQTSKNNSGDEHFSKSLASIDWPQICDMLSSQCQTQGGIEQALALVPVFSPGKVSHYHDLTRGVQSIAADLFDLSLTVADDVGPILAAISSGDVAGPKQIHTIGLFLGIRERIDVLAKDEVRENRALGTFLEQAYDRLPLVRQIQERVSPHGEVYDDASPKLRDLSREEAKDRESVQRRLDELIHTYEYQHILMENYVTLRDGRYVLPVRIAFHNQVKGVIHDVSNSRQTAFIEPFEIVKINNHLMQILEAKREECHKILRHLTDLIRNGASFIQKDLSQVFEIDLISAKVKWGKSVGAVLISPRPPQGKRPQGKRMEAFEILELYHPVLRFQQKSSKSSESKRVVPNDVVLDETTSGLVISGPNMGGKTILLKSIGCAVALSHCGVPVPCHKDSTIPLFAWIRFVIGDQQSVEEGFSSFTFQVEMMKDIPTTVKDNPRAGLVLVDEIMSATDPEEGEALAQAFITHWMKGKNMTAFVTTHYTHLKNLSMVGKIPMKFGSMEYQKGKPTFRFFQGSFGQSFGIETAEALGVPTEITQAARMLRGHKSVEMNELVTQLQTKVAEYDEKLHDARKRESQLEEQWHKLEKHKQDMEGESQKLEVEVTHQVWDAYEGLYKEIKDQLSSLKKHPSEAKLKKLHDDSVNVISRIRGKLASLGGKVKPKNGEWYYLPHLGKVQILDWQEEKKFALVLCKNKKIRLSLEHFAKARKV